MTNVDAIIKRFEQAFMKLEEVIKKLPDALKHFTVLLAAAKSK